MRPRARSILTSFTFLILHSTFLAGQIVVAPGDTAGLRRAAECVIRDFRQRAREAGAELPYQPRLKLAVTPQLIFFNDADSTIVVPWWAGLAAPLQQSFTALTQDSSQGRRLFLDLFNWYLLAHELTHALQAEYGQPWKPYASEAEANEGAVAYWVAAGAETRLLTLDGILARALTRIPDPTPAGQDPAAYFDQNYEALAGNPQAYGYYQFHFIREAIADRRSHTLRTVLRRLAKRP